MFKKNKLLQPGFNFIEMMVALVIIGIIVGLVGPRVFSILGRGRTTATKNTLKVIATGIQQYFTDVGTYPNTLEDLIKKPESAQNWQGPYAGDETKGAIEIPADAWGQAIKYKKNERGAIPPFDLWSEGDPEKEEDRISYAK
jgi:general secretion pathway protein G